MRKHNNSSKLGKRKAVNRDQKATLIPHPPSIDRFQVMHSQRIRYTVGTAFGGFITYQNLLDTINVATTATAPFNLFRMVRVRRIQIWAMEAIGTLASCQVTFGGITAGSIGDQKTHTATSMGIEPAYLDVKPSERALCSKYQPSSAAIAFGLTVPDGAVIDISLSYLGSAFANVLAAQNASTGATVGGVFWRGLDGVAVATSSFLLPATISQF